MDVRPRTIDDLRVEICVDRWPLQCSHNISHGQLMVRVGLQERVNCCEQLPYCPVFAPELLR